MSPVALVFLTNGSIGIGAFVADATGSADQLGTAAVIAATGTAVATVIAAVVKGVVAIRETSQSRKIPRTARAKARRRKELEDELADLEDEQR